jgi:hypothetical protein
MSCRAEGDTQEQEDTRAVHARVAILAMRTLRMPEGEGTGAYLFGLYGLALGLLDGLLGGSLDLRDTSATESHFRRAHAVRAVELAARG